MKRFLSLILMLCISLGAVPSYAASAKIDANILKALNAVNFSSKSNDTSETLKKWVKPYIKDSEDTAISVLSNGREYIVDKASPYTVYSDRKIIQNWTAKGKVDKTLGQCYTSKVDLSVWTTQFFYGVLTTDAWVKKSSSKYIVTKVVYQYKERNPSEAELQSEEVKYEKMYPNSYVYFDALHKLFIPHIDEEGSDATSSIVLDNGVSVGVDPEDSVIINGLALFKVDARTYDLSNNGYILAEIQTDKACEVSPDFAIMGLKKYEDNHTDYFNIINKATGKSVETENGNYSLQPDAVYQVVLYLSEDAVAKEDSLYVLWNF